MRVKDPFQYYYWGYGKLEFAVVTHGKKERFLAGTKEGILARLKEEREIEITNALPSNELSLGAAAVKAAKTVMRLMVGVLVELDPVGAIRSEEKQIRDEQRVEIPLLFDCRYDLGTFLLHFERDSEGKWGEAVACLAKALECSFADKRHAEAETKAVSFLRDRWNTWDPVCQFASLRIWRAYCDVREFKCMTANRQTSVHDMIKEFVLESENLIMPFRQQPNAVPSVQRGKFRANDPILRLPPMLHTWEDELRVWTTLDGGKECFVLSNSFYPIKLHIAAKMVEENVRYARCVECEKIFITSNGNEKLCGASCQNIRKRRTTAQYHKANKDNEVEREWERTRQQWHNCIKKARKIADFPPEQLNLIEEEFKLCRKLNSQKKQLVECGKMTLDEYKRWCSGQRSHAMSFVREF